MKFAVQASAARDQGARETKQHQLLIRLRNWNVDDAIEEVAEEASDGLSAVKESLAKAQHSMEQAKSAMQDAYGKAKDTAGVASDRAKVYLEDAKKYLG